MFRLHRFDTFFWLQLGWLAISSGRTHHPELPLGVWRLGRNGVQFFAGRYSLTIHWPSRLAV